MGHLKENSKGVFSGFGSFFGGVPDTDAETLSQAARWGVLPAALWGILPAASLTEHVVQGVAACAGVAVSLQTVWSVWRGVQLTGCGHSGAPGGGAGRRTCSLW